MITIRIGMKFNRLYFPYFCEIVPILKPQTNIANKVAIMITIKVIVTEIPPYTFAMYNPRIINDRIITTP